jgi:diguanylate cyclase (GGDEF)-like protein
MMLSKKRAYNAMSFRVLNQPLEYPTRAWVELVPAVLLGIGASLGAALILNYLLLFSEALSPFDRSMITAIALPFIIGAPLSLLLGYSRREVGHYRRALTRSASYDRETQLFNSNAFSSLVERRVSLAPRGEQQQGAFLIVNADNMREISMRYGLDWGTEALRLIASTIRSSVRDEDVVGRLDASEFGVFLPGATEGNAREVGERILTGIGHVYFAPGHESRELIRVSVAGVTFEDQLEFDGIYRAVEEQLSTAEETGVIEIAQMARAVPANGAFPAAH